MFWSDVRRRGFLATVAGFSAALMVMTASPVSLAHAGGDDREATSRTAAPTVTAAAEGSSKIVYACGDNLCAVDPASGKSTQLTNDGAGYTRPSISRDGRRVAAMRGSAVVAGPYGSGLPETWATHVEGLNDVAISPDGASVAASHWYTRLEIVYSYPCGACLELVHYNASQLWTAAGGVPAGHTGSAGVGFLGGALLSTTYQLGTWNSTTKKFEGSMEQICAVSNPADDAAACGLKVNEPDLDAQGRNVNITDPTGSPDGTLIAAVVGVEPEAAGGVVDNPTGESPVVKVYDAASGAFIAQLPGNGTNPTFSPDSTQIAYEGTDGVIYVVGARGGTPRKLVAGRQPSWGGGSIESAVPGGTGVGAVASKRATWSGRVVSVTLSCPKKSSGACKGTARVRVGKKLITGKRAYSVAPGRKSAVKIKLTAKGRRVLVRALKKRRSVSGRVDLSAPRSTAVAAKAKVSIRRR